MKPEDLRKAGLKVTHPRKRILEVLERVKPRHLSAEDLYRQLLDLKQDIGLATVYRVLSQCEAAGLVAKHHFASGHAVYELAREDHHDHMVDINSGRVIEFVDESIERLQREIAERHGYTLVSHCLVLYVRAKKR